MNFGLPTVDCELWTVGSSRADVLGISHEGEQEEERAEHVLALRDPGDRFHVQGMKGEPGGHQNAAPGGAGQALEQQEQEQGIRRVQDQVAQVMPARPHPK